jgi:site-specific DNA-methyltransferase (adenine-specific)
MAYAGMDDDAWEAFKDEVLEERGKLEVTHLAQRLRDRRVAERRAAYTAALAPSLPLGALLAVADARDMPLDDRSVDVIVTSPPYGLDIAYEGGDIDADGWAGFMAEWLAEALRVTKPSGRLALNIPLDTSEPTYRPTYAQAVVAALLAGWEYRSTVVWAEGNTTKGGWALGSQASAARPHHVSQVEMIVLLTKGAWGPSSANEDDITPDEFQVAGRGPWTFSGESRPWEDHPAAFPLELPRRLIPYLCRVGDVVLDPFCGSGTTLVAAVERGRRAIGFDIAPAYVESARRRLAQGGGT